MAMSDARCAENTSRLDRPRRTASFVVLRPSTYGRLKHPSSKAVGDLPIISLLSHAPHGKDAACRG